MTAVNDACAQCRREEWDYTGGSCCGLLRIGMSQCLTVWSPRTCDNFVVCSVSWHNKVYGCETWSLKPTLQTSMDRCYTRMLCAVLNIDHNEHVTNWTTGSEGYRV